MCFLLFCFSFCFGARNKIWCKSFNFVYKSLANGRIFNTLSKFYSQFAGDVPVVTRKDPGNRHSYITVVEVDVTVGFLKMTLRNFILVYRRWQRKVYVINYGSGAKWRYHSNGLNIIEEYMDMEDEGKKELKKRERDREENIKEARKTVMPFHMHNLPSELQYHVLSKFQPKTLCQYRQTCKLVNNLVETHRKRLNVTDYDDLWVLFVHISRGEEPEVQFTVRQDKNIDDSFHDFDSGNSILIEFPLNQLSCIRFEVVYVKFHHQVGANADGHEVIQSEKQCEVFSEEVLPVLKKMAVKCEWLVCVNMISEQAVKIVKSVNFSRLHTRRVEVNVEDVFRWPLETSQELYLHGIRGTPNSLRELNLRTERTDFFFCEEVNLFELLESYLKDIQDGKINIRKMTKIKLWRSGRVPYGEVLNLPGLEISWKGGLYRGHSRHLFGRDILYKMVVGKGMVLISQIKRAFFVYFVHNGTSRKDSLDHFHPFFFRRRPYDYSAYFEEFKNAATDQEAFDMLRDRYLLRDR